MKRTMLLDILRRAEPALAVREVENYTHLFFDGKYVYAHDGLVSIRAACPFPLSGGVLGKQLISFLTACSAEDYQLKGDESTFKIKVGSATLKLPMLPASGNPHNTYPTLVEENKIEVTDAVAAAIKQCGVTMGVDPSMPALLGITMEVQKNRVRFYSAVSHAATIATVDTGKHSHTLRGIRVLLPVRFCDLILATKPSALYLPSAGFTSDVVEAVYSYTDGTEAVRVQAATAAGDVDLSTIEQVEAQVEWEGFSTFPNKSNLLGAMERAMVILGGDEGKESLFRVAEGRLWISTKEADAHANDSTKLEGEHTDIEVRTRPTLLKNTLEFADKIRIFNHSIALTGPGYKSILAVAVANQ